MMSRSSKPATTPANSGSRQGSRGGTYHTGGASPRRRVPPEGLLIESDSMQLLPDLSPETLRDRADELKQMGLARDVDGGGGRNTSSLLVMSQGPGATPTPPPTELPLDGTRFASTARSLGRLARISSIMSPAPGGSSHPRFVEHPFGMMDSDGGVDAPHGGLARVGSVSDPTGLSRKRSIFGDFAGDADATVTPPTESNRRKTSMREEGGGGFSRLRRGSTFTHSAATINAPNGGAGAGGSGLGSLEHQLFRAAPSAVLAKLSTFVNNRNGDGGSWQRLSDLIDLYRKGVHMSQELSASPTAAKLKYSGEHYPSRIIQKATVRRRDGAAVAAAMDDDSNDDEVVHGDGEHAMVKSRRQQTENDMVDEWQSSIATASSLLNNILGLVTNTVPSLAPVCDSMRRVLLSAVYHNGRNLGTVMPLPSSVEACATETDYDQLKKKMDLFSVDPFAVISVETDLRKILHQRGGGGGGGGGSPAGGGGGDSLLDAVKTVRQLKRRFNTVLQFINFNMDGWRRLAMSCVLRAWKASRGRRVEEEHRTLEIGNLRAELEFLTNSKKTQQVELQKVANDRTAVAETAEMERATLRETYEKNIRTLETQVTNLKQLVQHLKKNMEAETLRGQLDALSTTNAKLEEQVVKLVEHITNAEGQLATLKQKLGTATGSIAALSQQLGAVTSQLSAEVHLNKPTLAKIAALGTSGGSIPPLAMWLTESAQTVVSKEVVYKALVDGLGHIRDGAAASLTASDLHNVSVRQSLVRVRDFGEGAQVLDAYVCVMHFLDENTITPPMVAEVMLEPDLLSKAQFVLEYSNILFTQGSRFRILGSGNSANNALRNPASFLSSSDLAFSLSVRPHLLMVSSLIALWMSTMCNVSLIPFGNGDPMFDMFLTRPLELETMLEPAQPGGPGGQQEVLAACSSRWEAVKECFVIWRNAMLALPSILIDYAAESNAAAVMSSKTVVSLSVPQLLAGSSARSGSLTSIPGGQNSRKDSTDNSVSTPPLSSLAASPATIGGLTPQQGPTYLAQRRHSALIRPLHKTPEERMIISQAFARSCLVEAVRSLLVAAFPPPKSNIGGKVAASSLSEPPPLTGASSSSCFSDEERIQIAANTISRRLEEEAPRLVAIFHYYAAPTSDVAAHLPILVLGAPQVTLLCRDIGILKKSDSGNSSSAGGAVDPSASTPPQLPASTTWVKQLLSDVDCREIVLSMSKKRQAMPGPAKGGSGEKDRAGVCQSKKNEDVLRSSLLIDEFAAFLVRLTSKCDVTGTADDSGVATSSRSSHFTAAVGSTETTTASHETSPEPTALSDTSADRLGGAEVITSQAADIDTPSHFLSRLEDSVGNFLQHVLLPRAFRVDVHVLRVALFDPTVVSVVDEYKPLEALLFKYCTQLSEHQHATNGAGGVGGKPSKASKSRSVVSQGQFLLFVADLASQQASSARPKPAGALPVDPQSQLSPSLPACVDPAVIFTAIQPVDNSRPLLLSSNDFCNALVALSLVWDRPSPLFHHAAKVVWMFENVLAPFASAKFPKEANNLRSTVVP